MKSCSKCAVLKEEEAFYVRSNGNIHAECKDCYKKRVRVRYYREHAKVLKQGRQYSTDKRKRVREATFAAYGGYICACCGEKEQKFLTLDHINNDGAEFRRKIAGKRSAAGMVTYEWLARNGFPSGYQVLCMNCNHGKRMNGGVCPHKTRCNDHPSTGAGPSGPERSAVVLSLVRTA